MKRKKKEWLGHLVKSPLKNDLAIWYNFFRCYTNFILFYFKTFFDVDHFLKSLLNLLQYCFCFTFWFFGHEACGILAPWPGVKPTPPALEGEVLTTWLPGRSLILLILIQAQNIKLHLINCINKNCLLDDGKFLIMSS